jgi:hypothetical protein
MGRILRICQEKATTVPKGPRIRKTGTVAGNRVVGLKSEKTQKSSYFTEIDVLGRFRQPGAYTSEKYRQ